jgi:RHS repeat-associated protein
LTSPGNQTNAEGDTVSLQVQASDGDGDALTYDELDLPPGLSINAQTGVTSGTVDYSAAEDFAGSYPGPCVSEALHDATCCAGSGNAAVGDRHDFTGREFAHETGLQYNRARYYDPTTGRWTSQDPLGFLADDTNLYR